MDLGLLQYRASHTKTKAKKMNIHTTEHVSRWYSTVASAVSVIERKMYFDAVMVADICRRST